MGSRVEYCVAAAVLACVTAPGIARGQEAFADLQYLYLVSFGDDSPYTSDFNAAQPNGQIREVDREDGSGARATLGIRSQSAVEAAVHYTYLNGRASESSAPPPGGSLSTTRLHPDNSSDGATAAAASSDLELHLVDLEVGKRFDVSEAKLRPFIGIRFARLSQSLDARYAVGGALLRSDDSLDLTGGGLRVGSDLGWSLMEGLAFEAGLSVSLLIANIESSHTESGALTATDVDRDYDRSVPIVDGYAGLRYERGPFFVGAGLETSAWFNKGGYITFTDDVADGQLTGGSDTLAFAGGYVRAGVAFSW